MKEEAKIKWKRTILAVFLLFLTSAGFAGTPNRNTSPTFANRGGSLNPGYIVGHTLSTFEKLLSVLGIQSMGVNLSKRLMFRAAETERLELGIPWLRRTPSGKWQIPYHSYWASNETVNRFLTPELKELYELTSPEGIRAVRILPGSNGKIAVIGRGQGNVESFAEFLRSQGHEVETIKNVPGIDEKFDDFLRFVGKRQKIYGSSYRLTRKGLKETNFYKTDEAWIIGVRDTGYTIIDVGDPAKRGSSDFLNMEYRHTFDWIRR